MALTKVVNGQVLEMDEAEEAEFLASQDDPAGKRARLRAALQQAFQARLAQGVSYQGKTIALDEPSQQRITSAYSLAVDAEGGGFAWPGSFAWRTADNSYLPLADPAACKAFCRAAGAEATRLRFKLFQLADTLAALPDGALDGFDPGASWDQG